MKAPGSITGERSVTLYAKDFEQAMKTSGTTPLARKAQARPRQVKKSTASSVQASLPVVQFPSTPTHLPHDLDREDMRFLMINPNEYDSRGRCVRHPHVRLRRKSVVSGEWRVLLSACPNCCVDELYRLQKQNLERDVDAPSPPPRGEERPSPDRNTAPACAPAPDDLLRAWGSAPDGLPSSLCTPRRAVAAGVLAAAAVVAGIAGALQPWRRAAVLADAAPGAEGGGFAPTRLMKLSYSVADAYLPVWYDRRTGWEGQTYEDAMLFCQSHHDFVPVSRSNGRLRPLPADGCPSLCLACFFLRFAPPPPVPASQCPYKVYCRNGSLLFDGDIGAARSSWAPVLDEWDRWVQLGDGAARCATSSGARRADGSDTTRILCCLERPLGKADAMPLPQAKSGKAASRGSIQGGPINRTAPDGDLGAPLSSSRQNVTAESAQDATPASAGGAPPSLSIHNITSASYHTAPINLNVTN